MLSFGTSSVALRAEVRNKITKAVIIAINRMVFVNLDDNGKPLPHGRKGGTVERL